MIATTARSLSHNPVKLSVLLLPVMRLVFKTTMESLSLEARVLTEVTSQSHQPIVCETGG